MKKKISLMETSKTNYCRLQFEADKIKNTKSTNKINNIGQKIIFNLNCNRKV